MARPRLSLGLGSGPSGATPVLSLPRGRATFSPRTYGLVGQSPRSIPRGETGGTPAIMGALYGAGTVDQDRLVGTPGRAGPEAVSHLLQRGLRRGRQIAGLDRDQVGQPLVVEARRIDRLFHVHPEIDDVDDALHDRGDDRRTAWAAGD